MVSRRAVCTGGADGDSDSTHVDQALDVYRVFGKDHGLGASAFDVGQLESAGTQTLWLEGLTGSVERLAST